MNRVGSKPSHHNQLGTHRKRVQERLPHGCPHAAFTVRVSALGSSPAAAAVGSPRSSKVITSIQGPPARGQKQLDWCLLESDQSRSTCADPRLPVVGHLFHFGTFLHGAVMDSCIPTSVVFLPAMKPCTEEGGRHTHQPLCIAAGRAPHVITGSYDHVISCAVNVL